MRETRIDESGHITVKNLSAYWIPEIRVEREIHGSVYTVTGSFEGNELLEKKLTYSFSYYIMYPVFLFL